MLSRTATRATAVPSRTLARHNLSRRYLGTTPPAQKPRSFKSSLARWALAIGGVYYVSTHDVFAQTGLPRPALDAASSERPDTIDALLAQRRERKAAEAQRGVLLADAPAASPQQQAQTQTQAAAPSAEGDAQQLEEEAEGEGAFNPETGEINWDCPCLGGMAHGPCGPEFREAFSCFVYSQGEPKGIECVPKFKNMQDCFRAHPDVYGAELTDDPTDEELEENARAAEAEAASARENNSNSNKSAPPVADAPYSGAAAGANVPERGMTSTPAASPRRIGGSTGYESTGGAAANEAKDKVGDARVVPRNERQAKVARAREARAQVASEHGQGEGSGAGSAEGELVPKAAHDASAANAAGK